MKKTKNIQSVFRLLLCIFAIVSGRPAQADVRLPSVLSSNMVLEQQSQIKLWGWGEPYEKISITTSWDHKTYPVIKPDGNAHWEINIQTPAAGGPYIITISGNNTILLKNVMIGEVWVCSGQSNMEMSGSWGLKDIKEELPKAYQADIRFFHVPKTTAQTAQIDGSGRWTICDSNTLKTFSAVAYFFGKVLHNALKVPVGLVEAAWSGSSAEVWTPESVINSDSILKQSATKIAANDQCPNMPGYAYNAMIAPLTNFNIAGVIWYQGENNTINAIHYTQLFTRMIDAWRSAWNKNLPFYYVQIAPYTYQLKNTGALLREAQTASLKQSNTGMVVITDLVADTGNVHPTDKKDVGYRLANWALGRTYQKSGIDYQSPLFKQLVIQRNKAVVSFANAEKGLHIRGKEVRELYISGADSIFYPAKSSIQNNKLVVWNPLVPHPVAVRFGFSNAGMGNLFSNNGLPVGPFRTDSWPVENQ